MALEITRTGNEVLITVVGTFDAKAAARLCSLLSDVVGSGEPARVTVDFGRAREVSAVGLAALVGCRAGNGISVRLRGLSRRDTRVMSYLGHDASEE